MTVGEPLTTQDAEVLVRVHELTESLASYLDDSDTTGFDAVAKEIYDLRMQYPELVDEYFEKYSKSGVQ